MLRSSLITSLIIASLFLMGLRSPARGIVPPTENEVGFVDTRFYIFLLDNNHDPNDGLVTDPQGYEWPEDLPVTLTIDLPGTTDLPDYTLSPSFSEPMQPGVLHHYFDTSGIISHPGDIFAITNGVTTFIDTIHAFAVTALDADTDTIRGIAAPGTTVQVSFREPWNERHATANGSGIWTEDFSVPGDDPGETATSDLLPGSPFFVSQDLNTYEVRVPNPHIEANITSNWIKAREWPLGASVTLLIDDPATISPVDYSAFATVADDQNTWEWHMTGAIFPLGGFDLQSGHVVSILYDSKVKSHTVLPLQVAGFDFEGDIITGEGVAGHTLLVCVYDGDNPCRSVTVDGDGSWTANFHIAGPNPGEEGIHDIQPGTSGRVTDQEADGDQTIATWMATLNIYLPLVIKN